ncbi:hypothetical protein BY458DRAFT_513776 [Sporodiniella umbellata]|nr:hypothetical protein BY458DRAFT_513776 [Sporodiniella umbellata]
MTDLGPQTIERQLKIMNPPSNSSIPELPESAYKLDNNEIKKLYQSSVDRKEKLENSPLKTQKMRDAEEQEKLKKNPKTTIRVRMPDYTIIQGVFESKEKVSEVYAFVRTLLENPERKFVLCLPPRTKLIDPTISIYKAGLSPASNVLFGWIEKGEKTQNDLKQEYLNMKEDLPQSPASSSISTPTSAPLSKPKTSLPKAVPKWLQKGLFKK